jgi:hypothetical protein
MVCKVEGEVSRQKQHQRDVSAVAWKRKRDDAGIRIYGWMQRGVFDQIACVRYIGIQEMHGWQRNAVEKQSKKGRSAKEEKVLCKLQR